MADDTILIRVRALIDRAAHEATPEEEARSSAVIACKLIHKHSLLATVATTFSAAEDFTRSYSTPSASTRSASAKKPKGRSRPWVDPTYDDEDPDVVKLVSKFRGRCLSCLKAYEVGETIWWQRGVGVTHESCKDYWEDV